MPQERSALRQPTRARSYAAHGQTANHNLLLGGMMVEYRLGKWEAFQTVWRFLGYRSTDDMSIPVLEAWNRFCAKLFS